jgi:hypothetical protein
LHFVYFCFAHCVTMVKYCLCNLSTWAAK